MKIQKTKMYGVQNSVANAAQGNGRKAILVYMRGRCVHERNGATYAVSNRCDAQTCVNIT